MSDLMTTKEASEYLKLSYMTLYKLAQQGDIPAYKLGGHWRFNKTVLNEWFANKSQVIDKTTIQTSQDTNPENQAKYQLITELIELRQRIDNIANADNDRTLIEESLRLSEEKLRNFMESSNDSFILLDAKFNVININSSAIKYLPAGFNRKNVIGKCIIDILPNVVESRKYEQYLEVLKTGEPLEIRDIIVDHGFGETHMSIKVFKVGSGLGVIGTDITELRLLESIKDSEIFNANLLDNAPNPILVYAADTAIRYVNQALEELTGFSLNELVGQKIPYPWWQENTMEKVLASFKDPNFSTTKKIEIQFKKKSGEPFWVELNAKSIKKNDKTTYLISSWVDITERKNAEAALLESEKKYRALVEQSLQGIMIIQDNRIVFVNNVLAKAAGYSIEQLLSFSSQEVFEFIHPDDREIVFKRMQERLEGKAIPPRYEFRLVERNGAIHWIDMNSNLIEYSGKPAIQLAIVDITDRKKASEALLQEKNFSEATINSLPGVFYMIDAKVNLVKWNKNLEIESGYTAEEIAKISPLELFNKNDQAFIQQRIEKTFNEGKDSVEVNAVTKSGRIVPYHLTSSLVTLNDNIYLVGVGIEISERKRMEAEVRACEENLKSFLDNAPDAMFVHDIEGKILDFNKKAEELLDITRKDYIGKSVLDTGLIGKKYMPIVIDGLKEIEKGRASKPVETELTTKKGSRIVVEITGFPITRNGKTQVCDIIRDITNIIR
jgi:PAS domain S-box-containing protein/excisionase family DNA binding protein